MSWLSLPLPLPNPFKSQQQEEQNLSQNSSEEDEDDDQLSPSHGVKEDLTELGKTISRQLWGVASFLAPPPASSSSSSSETADRSSQTLVGIRNDFAEISGSLKSSLSFVSPNKISKLASNLLQFEEEYEKDVSSGEDFVGGGGVGVAEEVLEFVQEMSMRPECWIGFPMSLDDNDFDLSNTQREHVSTIERLAPNLAVLRSKLCPSDMNEDHFWRIYFILLHPRLNKHDSELLSTAQIVEARDTLLQTSEVHSTDNKGQEEEKEVLSETVNAAHEEDVERGTCVDGGIEQDVSFSDLEDDENDTSSPVQSGQASGWVQLNENSDTGGSKSREKDSEGEESNEWLTVDEYD